VELDRYVALILSCLALLTPIATVPPPQDLFITGYLPKDDGAKHAMKDADIVIIPAGIPRTHKTPLARISTDGTQASQE
jgi:hypothetical protein